MEDSIFENFKSVLSGGGVRAVSAPQLFPTPSDLAARMVDLADIGIHHRVLEPSAGTGRILQELPALCLDVVAVELNYTLANGLRELKGLSRPMQVIRGDFLECNDLGVFDRVIVSNNGKQGKPLV